MKNKSLVQALAGLSILAALALTGCVTGSDVVEVTSTGNFGELVRTPVKDFESLGIILTENRFQSIDSRNDEQQVFTYQELLKKAQAIGADSIINVVIDKKVEANTASSSQVTTWYGSALAIKYTGTFPATESESTTVSSGGTTTTTTKTSVYLNDDDTTKVNARMVTQSRRGKVELNNTRSK